MLNVMTFEVNMLCENCYVVSDETQQAVIIDCGAFYPYDKEAILNYISSKSLEVKHILCTHTHFDHIFGLPFAAKEWGINPIFHEGDAKLYQNMKKQVADFIGHVYQEEMPPVAQYIKEGDEITFGHHQFKVIHTPGHSKGGVSFYCAQEKILFSGDSLFAQSIGRTDLPDGNYKHLIENLTTKILTLPEDTIVYPGHGPTTTIKKEKQSNPYLS